MRGEHEPATFEADARAPRRARGIRKLLRPEGYLRTGTMAKPSFTPFDFGRANRRSASMKCRRSNPRPLPRALRVHSRVGRCEEQRAPISAMEQVMTSSRDPDLHPRESKRLPASCQHRPRAGMERSVGRRSNGDGRLSDRRRRAHATAVRRTDEASKLQKRTGLAGATMNLPLAPAACVDSEPPRHPDTPRAGVLEAQTRDCDEFGAVSPWRTSSPSEDSAWCWNVAGAADDPTAGWWGIY